MESLVFYSLVIAMMFAGTNCYSSSQSCSTVNGKTVCESQSGDGNTAGAFSGAFSNGQTAYQQAGAGIGNTYTGSSSSSQSSSGNLPPGSFVGPAPAPFDPFAFAGLPNPFGLLGGGAFAFAGRR